MAKKYNQYLDLLYKGQLRLPDVSPQVLSPAEEDQINKALQAEKDNNPTTLLGIEWLEIEKQAWDSKQALVPNKLDYYKYKSMLREEPLTPPKEKDQVERIIKEGQG